MRSSLTFGLGVLLIVGVVGAMLLLLQDRAPEAVAGAAGTTTAPAEEPATEPTATTVPVAAESKEGIGEAASGTPPARDTEPAEPTDPAAPDEEADGATVRGHVADSDGQPIQGVELVAVNDSGQGSDTVSGADGAYELTGLPTGQLQLSAQHPDWAPEVLPLELAAGEVLEKIDILLEPGLSIAGRIVDSAGAAIVEASVSATLVSEGSSPAGSLAGLRVVKSGADGRFAIRGLDPGRFAVVAEHISYVKPDAVTIDAGTEDLEIVLQPAGSLAGLVLDPAGAPVAGATVTVRSPDRAEATFALTLTKPAETTTNEQGHFLISVPFGDQRVVASAPGFRESEEAAVTVPTDPEQPLELRLREGVAISGFVVTSRGLPIAGARVAASTVQRSRAGLQNAYTTTSTVSAGASRAATSDESGAFTVGGLAPGTSYHLTAVMEGYVDPAARLESDAVTAPATQVEIRLQQEAVLAGIVRDPAGLPIEGAHLELYEKDRPVWQSVPQVAASQEDGTFRMARLAAGDYELHANHTDHAPSERLGVTLSSGEVREGVELRLQAGGDITGKVVDPLGEPVPGARITALDMSNFADARRTMLHGSTGDDGTFTLKGAGTSTYSLNAVAEGFEKPDTYGMGAMQKPKYPAVAGDFVLIRLSRGITLVGSVVDDAGKPVTSFSVEALVASPFGGMELPKDSESFSAADGTFRWIGVPAETRAAIIRARGYARHKLTFGTGLAADSENDCGVIRLTGGATLAGRVVTKGGDPVPAAQVTVEPVDPGASGTSFAQMMGSGELTAKTDDAGAFRFEHVPPGDNKVTASSEEHATVSRTLKLEEGAEKTDLRLVMPDGGEIVGIVLGDSGQPVRGATMNAIPSGGMFGAGIKTTRTDGDGRYRLAGLTPGRTMVQAQLMSSTGQNQRTKSVVVPEEGTVECNFIEDNLCRVHGKVLGGDAAELQAGGMSGMLILFSMSGGNANQNVAQITDEGAFEFDPVPPGRYRLMLMGSSSVELDVPELDDYRYDYHLPQAAIHGRVVLEEGGEVGTVQLRAMRRGAPDMVSGAVMAVSAEDGTFALRFLQDGVYDIYADVPDVGSGSAQGIDVTGGQRIQNVQVVVGGGGELRVTVRDLAGNPAPEAAVLCEDALGNSVGVTSRGPATTDASGSTTIDKIPAGTYRVIAGSESLGTIWQDGVTVTSGSETPVELTLPTARGRASILVEVSGSPVPGARIELLQSGRPVPDLGAGFMTLFTGASTNPQGRHQTGPLPTGTYTLRVTKDSLRAEQELTLPADGSTLEVTVQL